MLKVFLFLSVFSLAIPAFADETIQFAVELGLRGCRETAKVHECGGSLETTRDNLEVVLKCVDPSPKGECGLFVGDVKKEYVLHWGERRVAQRTGVLVNVSKLPKTTYGKPLYSITVKLAAEGDGEEDVRSSYLSVSNFDSLHEITILGRTTKKPGRGKTVLSQWTSLDLREFMAFP